MLLMLGLLDVTTTAKLRARPEVRYQNRLQSRCGGWWRSPMLLTGKNPGPESHHDGRRYQFFYRKIQVEI
jgi:hypothetical protein